MPTRYHGQTDVAHWCGVTRAAVSNWMKRYPDEHPKPDVIIENDAAITDRSRDNVTRGWLPERRPEWEAFAAARQAGPSASGRKTHRAAHLIYQQVQDGKIDPAEAVKLLHELL